MKKNVKRFISIIMVMTMVFVMAAGCGKKEEAAAEKEEPKTAVEESAEKKAAKAEESETPEDANEYGIVEADFYNCIKNSVLTNYLEPNNINPAEFQWPEYEERNDGSFHDEDFLWTYFNTIYSNYSVSGKLFDTTDLPVPEPERKEMMDAVLTGIDEWRNIPGNEEIKIFKINAAFSPFYETIPANVNFAE